MEDQEARNLAAQFVAEFAEAKDLAPVVRSLYVDDFVERFNKYKFKNPNSSFDLYFIPGLEYDSALLAQGAAEDWRRFYIAANTFIFYGVVSVSRKATAIDGQKISANDIYPRRVIELLNRNPNLANVIERKGAGRVIRSMDELRDATNTFQQAIEVLRESIPVRPVNRRELLDAMKDDLFKPQVEFVKDEEWFGFPKNARFIYMKTPVLFSLMFVRENGQLRIVYAIPYID